MSELVDVLTRAIHAAGESRQGGDWVDDVYVKSYPTVERQGPDAPIIINIDTRNRKLTKGDVTALRAALAEIGYVEIESWVASQGVSWLSPGVSAGVSFRVKRKSEDETRHHN